MKTIKIKIEQPFTNSNNKQFIICLPKRKIKKLLSLHPNDIVTPRSVTISFEDGFEVTKFKLVENNKKLYDKKYYQKNKEKIKRRVRKRYALIPKTHTKPEL
jgi:hypothetical protein